MTDVTHEQSRRYHVALRLTVRQVMSDAIGLYRREPERVAFISLVTFIPIDALTVALHGWSEHLLMIGHTQVSAGAEFIAFLLVTAGQVFLAGILDHLAEEKVANEPAHGLLEVAEHLPLLRLILADILVSLIASVASLALVVPGFIAFALFGIVGVVINVEDREVVDALRRSASLVWPHLWIACVVIALPLMAELLIEDWYLAFAHSSPWLFDVLVSCGLSLTVRPFISLLEVVLGQTLIHRDWAVPGRLV